MKEVCRYNFLNLVFIYNNYYIRFTGGMHTELICDIKISESEADKIIKKPKKMQEVFDDYKSRLAWNEETFLISGLRDFISHESNLDNMEIESLLVKLNENKDIKLEMYDTSKYESFPVNSAIKIDGVTAEDLYKEGNITRCEAYIKLLKKRILLNNN